MQILIVDCATGEAIQREMTIAEAEAHLETLVALERDTVERAARRSQLDAARALIAARAAEDPTFAALAQLLGARIVNG